MLLRNLVAGFVRVASPVAITALWMTGLTPLAAADAKDPDSRCLEIHFYYMELLWTPDCTP